MNDRGVDRSDFAALLNADDEACARARGALAAGADFISPRGDVPATHLVGTYRVRLRSTAARAIPTVGLAKAVGALDAAGNAHVSIGEIGGRADPWHFIVFVDHDSGRLLACTGVERAVA